MTTTSETKSHFEQLLSKIYARRLHENNQKVCIDCLKPRSNKNKFECKKCGCSEFYVLDRLSKFFICNIVCFVMYKNGSIVKN